MSAPKRKPLLRADRRSAKPSFPRPGHGAQRDAATTAALLVMRSAGGHETARAGTSSFSVEEDRREEFLALSCLTAARKVA